MQTLWFLIKLFFQFAIAFAFLHTCVTHFLLWYEQQQLRLQNQEVVRVSWKTWLQSFVTEFFCVSLKGILYPFQFWSFDANTKAEAGVSVPILLVHGYLNHKVDWLWFLKTLKKNPNIGPIYAINLFPPFASITQLALTVKAKVNEIRETTKAPQVILIGHSMGGLVCSYFSEYLANPNEIAMVIALGSPFQGTKLTALGYGLNVKEMSPNSSFLSELNTRIHQSTIPYYSIASKIDNMIIPWQSALLSDVDGNTLENTMVLEDHGHLRLLISKPVLEQITKWIVPQPKAIS